MHVRFQPITPTFPASSYWLYAHHEPLPPPLPLMFSPQWFTLWQALSRLRHSCAGLIFSFSWQTGGFDPQAVYLGFWVVKAPLGQVPVGPHVFYMNILYEIGCKNIHTVLLKLYNQFYMNIRYEIVCKNVHTFMKKNIWILLANFRWNK